MPYDEKLQGPALVQIPDLTTEMSCCTFLHYSLIGEGMVQMLRHNVRNVDSLRMTVLAIPVMYLRVLPTSPLKEGIVVKEYRLFHDFEGQAMALRVVRRPNVKRRAH